jgi:hypothetical protein
MATVPSSKEIVRLQKISADAIIKKTEEHASLNKPLFKVTGAGVMPEDIWQAKKRSV